MAGTSTTSSSVNNVVNERLRVNVFALKDLDMDKDFWLFEKLVSSIASISSIKKRDKISLFKLLQGRDK